MICASVVALLSGCSEIHSDVMAFTGMCDASAGVAVGPFLIVANDEDNVLRIYAKDAGTGPVATYDLTPYLHLEFDGKSPEVDIEGASCAGDRIFWIGSHGRNKDDLFRPNRHRLFCTAFTVSSGGVMLRPEGVPYVDLLKDLSSDSRYRSLFPTDEGNSAEIDIEALSFTPGEKSLLIGFRAPLIGTNALLVSLENPHDVLLRGAEPKFGDPLLLDLDGYTFRSMEYSARHRCFLISAGSPEGDRPFRLYRWSGEAAAPPDIVSPSPEITRIEDFTPEAVIVDNTGGTITLLSDDGTVKMVDSAAKGKARQCDCKELKDVSLRRFKSVRISVE